MYKPNTGNIYLKITALRVFISTNTKNFNPQEDNTLEYYFFFNSSLTYRDHFKSMLGWGNCISFLEGGSVRNS